MCGIVGVFGQGPVNQVLYDSLSMLQHRGQDAAGIATSFLNRFYLHKGNGLVNEVFDPASMAKLIARWGLGMCATRRLVADRWRKHSRSM